MQTILLLSRPARSGDLHVCRAASVLRLLVNALGHSLQVDQGFVAQVLA